MPVKKTVAPIPIYFCTSEGLRLSNDGYTPEQNKKKSDKIFKDDGFDFELLESNEQLDIACDFYNEELQSLSDIGRDLCIDLKDFKISNI